MRRVWVVFNKAGDAITESEDVVQAFAAAAENGGLVVVGVMVGEKDKPPLKIRLTEHREVHLAVPVSETKPAKVK